MNDALGLSSTNLVRLFLFGIMQVTFNQAVSIIRDKSDYLGH